LRLIVRDVSKINPLGARLLVFLETHGTSTARELETELAVSHKRGWALMKRFQSVSWIKRENGRYAVGPNARRLNVYDPSTDGLIGRAARRLLVTVKDYGPVSLSEASRIAGLPKGTAVRQTSRLLRMNLMKRMKLDAYAIDQDILDNMAAIDLCPTKSQKLFDFLQCAEQLNPMAIVAHGFPTLTITAISDQLEPRQVYVFGEKLGDCVRSSGFRPQKIQVASKHAWLQELHRIHYPPALNLREAILGLPIHGSKPKPDYAELYAIYTHYAPLTDEDVRKWTSKRWITRIDGRLAFTAIGVEQTRKLRQATKIFKETMQTNAGFQIDYYFA